MKPITGRWRLDETNSSSSHEIRGGSPRRICHEAGRAFQTQAFVQWLNRITAGAAEALPAEIRRAKRSERIARGVARYPGSSAGGPRQDHPLHGQEGDKQRSTEGKPRSERRKKEARERGTAAARLATKSPATRMERAGKKKEIRTVSS